MNFYKLLILNFLFMLSGQVNALIQKIGYKELWIQSNSTVNTVNIHKKTDISIKIDSIIHQPIIAFSNSHNNSLTNQLDESKPNEKYDNDTDSNNSYWLASILGFLLIIVFIWAKLLAKRNKNIHLELIQQKSNFHNLIEHSLDGQIIIKENQIIDCNQTVISMLGISNKNKLINKKLSDILIGKQLSGEDSLEYVQNEIKKCHKNGFTRFEFYSSLNQLNSYWIDVIFKLIKYNNEKVIYATFRDITKLKSLTHDLIKAQQVAEEANNAKSEFLANMSHEIRTPMNAILGFTELLEEQITDPKHHSFVKTIKSASKNLLSLINDILDLSKIEAGKFTSQKKALNPYDLINDICQVFSLNIQEKDLRFEIEIDPSLPNSLIIDAIHIRQILFNLFSNAIKFTETGHIIFRANVTKIDENLSSIDLQFEIEDTGIGIAEDQLDTVFNVFEQHKGQDINTYQGTGLGLSISQKLAENMGGNISVISTKGVGSTFTVNIFNVDIASIESNEINEFKINELTDINFKPSTVLIADDIDYNRKLIAEIFNQTPIKVLQAENGLKAIEMVQNHSINLVIMDIRMPIMDGYKATRKIKKNNPNLPIIALTASTLESDKELTTDLFNAYIRKPVNKKELINTLAQFLPHKKTRSTILDENKPYKNENYDKKVLIQLIDRLNDEPTQLWTKAKESNHFNHIKAFANSLTSILIEFPILPLKNYTSNLNEKIDRFDIAGLQKALNAFTELLSEISHLKNEL